MSRKQIDPSDYSVRVKKVIEDGEEFWRGTVEEFPDLAVYESSEEAALLQARAVLEDLISHFIEGGHPVPAPLEEPTYSGRLTLRVPPRLHRQLDEMAKEDQCSLNQLICAELALAVAQRFRPAHFSRPAERKMAHVVAVIGSTQSSQPSNAWHGLGSHLNADLHLGSYEFPGFLGTLAAKATP